MISVKLNGTDVTNLVGQDLNGTLSLTKQSSTLDFTISAAAGSSVTPPAVGNTVELADSSGTIFGGTVTQVDTTISGLRVAYAVTCTDWTYLMDGTLVKQNYAGLDPADIVNDIITNFCSGKGFTTNHVQRGNFTVPSIKFNYQQPSKCLQSLAKLIGWEWYVDPNKDIHFFLADVTNGIGVNGSAPILVDQTGGNSGQDIEWNSLDSDLNIQNMQNSAYVIGGTYRKYFIKNPQANTNPPQYAPIDIYQTDGVKTAYSLAYTYDTSSLTVLLNGVQQSVGVDQQDNPSQYQCMYNTKGSFLIFPSPPAAGQTLEIEGFAEIPIVAYAKDASSIATYGEYQTVISDSKILTVAEAQARAQAAIAQFGHPVTTVKVTTLVPGCRPGQAIYVDLPHLNTQKWLVIKQITTKMRTPGATDGKLEYELECLGSDNVNFTDLMTTLLQQQSSQTQISDSTVTQAIELLPSEALTVGDTLTVSTTASTTFKWDGNSTWGYTTWN